MGRQRKYHKYENQQYTHMLSMHYISFICMHFILSLSLSSGKLEYEFLSPPQYILESGLGRKGCVGVTQPRRVAAVSIAIRVALERCCPLGQEVL